MVRVARAAERRGAQMSRLGCLRALASGEWRYGLDMVKDTGSGLHRGTIYVDLARLVHAGLVEREEVALTLTHPTLETVEIERPKFRLTAEGRAALEAGVLR